jgi:hypothetical protein
MTEARGAAPNPPSSLIDRLLAEIPQEAAAATFLATDLGENVLISCGNMAPEEHELVATLDSDHYNILLLASTGLSFAKIAKELRLTQQEVIDRFGPTYQVLEVDNPEGAATFIPMSERRLRGIHDDVLEPFQDEIISRMADGWTNSHIANARIVPGEKLEPPHIGSHKAKIIKLLGLKGPIHLIRFASARKNVQRYGSLVERAANTTRPVVQTIIANLETEGGRELDSESVAKIARPELLGKLAAGGYIDAEAAETGELNLAGTIAALLMSRPGVEDIMLNKLARPTIKTVIDKEAADYLAND